MQSKTFMFILCDAYSELIIDLITMQTSIKNRIVGTLVVIGILFNEKYKPNIKHTA